MADSASTPKERVRIFKHDGTPIAEFRTRVDRSWALGEEGRAEFSYPTRKTQIVNGTVLRFGNWILVENDFLPPWVGMIDYPRSWNPRQVTVRAYTPERQLFYRRGPKDQVLNMSPGELFAWIINYANGQGRTVLRVGNVYRGGATRQETMTPNAMNNDLKRIWERSGEDYNWRPGIDATGKLIILSDWYAVMGRDTGILLHEGKGGGNIEATSSILIEDGPIYNDVMGYGDGATWQTKPSISLVDYLSRYKYGLRQTAKEFQNVSALSTIRENTAKHLSVVKEPVRTFNVHAINIGSTFQNMRLGNTFTLRFENVGFRAPIGYESKVRLTGMQYDPKVPGKLELVVEEVTPTL